MEDSTDMSLRTKLLNDADETLGHNGIQKTVNLISPNNYWPNMTQDINQFAKHCDICQKN